MAEESIKAVPTIPERLLERIRVGLTLPDDKLKQINDWAKNNYQLLISSEFDDNAMFERMEIQQSQFYGALATISSFLFGMEASARPDVDVYVQELKKKGLGELAEKARLLIGGINVDASALELARQRTQALQSIVPTLDSVDCVCELRAIFRRQPSPNQSEKHFRDFKVLLGFEPVALVNVQLNNAANEDVPCSFQVTERSLKSLIKTLQEAAEQLEIIKRMGVRAPEK